MRKQQLRYVWLLVLTLLLVLTACRQKEETPPVPTAMPTAVLLATPTTAPTPRPTATAVPIAAVALPDLDWPPQLVYSSPARGECAISAWPWWSSTSQSTSAVAGSQGVRRRVERSGFSM